MLLRTSLVLILGVGLLGACSGGDEEGHPATHHDGMNGENHQGMEGMGHEGMEPGGATGSLPEGANPVCPVTGEPVDPAVHVEHAGKTVYFCCRDCVSKFEADPDAYMAKAYPEGD
jgi:Cu+-exporting ATPase